MAAIPSEAALRAMRYYPVCWAAALHTVHRNLPSVQRNYGIYRELHRQHFFDILIETRTDMTANVVHALLHLQLSSLNMRNTSRYICN